VQVNGRTRGVVQLSPDAASADAIDAARRLEVVRRDLANAAVERVVYVPQRILNIVTSKTLE
jgi:leucyl-tRNA synthetase